MQSYTPVGGKTKPTELLGPPPVSGSISVYAQKLTSLAFVTLCSTVVAGHEANFASAFGNCKSSCQLHITLGVFSFVFSLSLLFANRLAEGRTISREGWFSHRHEMYLIGVLIVVWLIGVGSVSSQDRGEELVRWFAWLAFFGSMYATFKAYHSSKEEDLPTVLPD
eukprot:IDg7310t1